MYHFHGLEDNIISISILLKLLYRFNTVPVQLPAVFFPEINKLILKCMWQCKGKAIYVKDNNKEQNWRTYCTRYKSDCKYRHLDSVVLVQAQTD